MNANGQRTKSNNLCSAMIQFHTHRHCVLRDLTTQVQNTTETSPVYLQETKHTNRN